MKKLFLLLTFFVLAFGASASQILASVFGYNATNATSALNNAILSSYDTIIVDKQLANWKTGPLVFNGLNNKTIIFETGVIVEAIPGAFNDINACLFKFKNSDNINLIGYGAVFKMNKAEYAALNNSEYRMNISLTNCKFFTIKGLYLDESGGDGIYIGGDGINFCKSILLEDVVCNNHYRQGMSITNVEDMIVRNCKFLNTKGTQPEAGVDIEPYQITQRIVNLKFEKCAFQNNGWSGLAVAVTFLNSTSLPISIQVVDCYFKNNGLPTNTYALCEIFLGADKQAPVNGNVLFERCFIDGSQYSALYTRKTADAYKVKFKDCAFQRVSQLQTQYNEPIFLEVPDYSNPCGYLGGLEFENVFISYNTNFNFFRIYGWATMAGIKDITGSFTIVEPNHHTPLYSNVNDTVNVTYAYNNQTTLPQTTVDINTLSSNAIECDQAPAIAAFSRSSSNLSYPLGIAYTNSGNCTLGDDVLYPPGGIIISAFSNLVRDSIWARKDNIQEVSEVLNTTIASGTDYTLGSNIAVAIQLNDCNIITGLDPGNAVIPFVVYPNPSNGIVFIKSDTRPDKIEIINALGKICIQVGSSNTIDISKLANGIYYIRTYFGRKIFSAPLLLERK
ncbi:MAG TPA: T9SS type A sorting domain-containing protein [Chitinophagaceae bacterium]|nr:T9SS type A sorting domain-containing protein [Chitinophagaceae bacterium]